MIETMCVCMCTRVCVCECVCAVHNCTTVGYNVSNVVCFMSILFTRHQVQYSECLHLVFSPINNNVRLLIHLYCNVLILVGYHCTN